MICVGGELHENIRAAWTLSQKKFLIKQSNGKLKTMFNENFVALIKILFHEFFNENFIALIKILFDELLPCWTRYMYQGFTI